MSCNAFQLRLEGLFVRSGSLALDVQEKQGDSAGAIRYLNPPLGH